MATFSPESNVSLYVRQSKADSPETPFVRTPSEHNVIKYSCSSSSAEQICRGEQLVRSQSSTACTSTFSLNVVQQKIRHMLRREGSAISLRQERSQSLVQCKNMRKCKTMIALTRAPQTYSPISNAVPNFICYHGSGIFNANGVEKIRPLNRLRHSVKSMNTLTCIRCSSHMSLAVYGSRRSLNVSKNPYQNIDISSAIPRLHDNNDNADTNQISPNHIQPECVLPIRPIKQPVMNKCNLYSEKNNILTSSNLKKGISADLIVEKSSEGLINYDAAESSLTTENCVPKTASSLLSISSNDEQEDQRKGESRKCKKLLNILTCKLCLVDVAIETETTTLSQCNCRFCTECLRAYVEFEISEGAYEISCPDALCPSQGILTLQEISCLTTSNLLKKHHRYRLNREIELDKTRTWCPRAGCETVCLVRTSSHAHFDTLPSTSNQPNKSQALVAVHCPSCKEEFCSACRKTWHPNISCEDNSRRLIADGQADMGIPFDDAIKCCPMCAVPIEKDEGCAQMMCKRCKHVFCWYCLASLDDDFLLRHYDKGPCKNKLGHSRASIVWHRAQVIGIFAGFGILLLVASPILLLAAPCIICCKCRSCSGSKVDEGDGELDDVTALQS